MLGGNFSKTNNFFWDFITAPFKAFFIFKEKYFKPSPPSENNQVSLETLQKNLDLAQQEITTLKAQIATSERFGVDHENSLLDKQITI